MSYITTLGNKFMLNGSRFRAIGINTYPLIQGDYSTSTLDAFFAACNTYGIKVVRTWCYSKDNPATNTVGNFRYISGTTLNWVESTFVSLDRVLDSANRHNVKMILSLTEGNNNHDDYLKWSDAIYGTTYYPTTSQVVSSITRSGTTATVITPVSHGYNTDDRVTITGANQTDYNVSTKYITKIDATTFSYTVSNSPATPATGTITVQKEVQPWSFYLDSNIITMYEQFVNKLATRVNTVNGRTYSADDAIFSIELGNELRYNRDEGYSGSNQNLVTSVNLANLSGTGGWADTVSTYIKTQFPNHLCGYGDLGHRWAYTSNDAVYNGTYYGVDFQITSALSNLDYADYHEYPWGADNNAFKPNSAGWFGVKIGFPTNSAAGYVGQVDEFAKLAKITNTKPVLVGENGIVKTNTGNVTYVSYPRWASFARQMNEFFSRDGDIFIIWHGATAAILDDNNYNIRLDGVHTGGNANNNMNDDDTNLLSVIAQKAKQIQGTRINVTDIAYGAIV